MAFNQHEQIAVLEIQQYGLDKFKKGTIIKVAVDQDIYEYYVLVANPADVANVSVSEAIENEQLLKIKYGKDDEFVKYDVIISQENNYSPSSLLGKPLKYNWSTGTLGINVDITDNDIADPYDMVIGEQGKYLAYMDTPNGGLYVGYHFAIGDAFPAQAKIDMYKDTNSKYSLQFNIISDTSPNLNDSKRFELSGADDDAKFINLPNGLKLINNGEANDAKRAMMFINFVANDGNATALLEPMNKPTFIIGGVKESDGSSFVIYWTDGNGNVYKDELWGWQIN